MTYDSDWCWFKICKCRDEADKGILDYAESKFNNSDYEYSRFGWWGLDWDNDGKKEVNCWYVVNDALQSNGYSGISPIAPLIPLDLCRVEYADAAPGDIIVFYPTLSNLMAGSHVGIVSAIADYGNGVWKGLQFTAQNEDLQIMHLFWSSEFPNNPPYPQYIGGIYRPKECDIVYWTCALPGTPEKPPNTQPPDPLILDLNGNGIQTLGLDAGIHFDNDGNGFKELGIPGTPYIIKEVGILAA